MTVLLWGRPTIAKNKMSQLQIVLLASVVQTLDSAVQRINHYPADSLIRFANTYPLDSDLSSG